MGTEPMFVYQMPPSGGAHGLRRKQLVEIWRVVAEWFAAWTDCVGPHRIDGLSDSDALLVPRRDDRAWRASLPASTLDALTHTFDARARAGERGRLTLGFEFLLRDPSEGALLPYADDHFPDGYSDVVLFLHDGEPCAMYLTLRWPFPGPNEAVVATCDGIRAHLGVTLSPSKFMRGERTKRGTIRYRRYPFGAGARAAAAPPARVASPLEARLLEAIVATPDDDGPRLAYADVLTLRGDPRGELIVVQCQLAALAADDPRRPALLRRERALLAAHGRTWTRIPYADGAELRRGFVECVRVTDVGALIAFPDAMFEAAPLVREVQVTTEYDLALLQLSPLAARLGAITRAP